MTEVERFNDGTGAWEPIDYGSFEIEFGVSDILIAPQATVTAPRTSLVSAGERIRVREDGVTTFEGRVQRTKPRTKGPMRIEAEHDAHALFDDTVTLTVSGTDEDVLNAALSDAGDGSWTLSYVGTATTLGDDYDVEGRSVKRVFRDMVDRVGRIWWVGVDHTITVAAYGAGGQLAAVDTATDDATVDDYTPADIETVLNDVTVVGTGGQSVTGSASDSTSVSDYGRQPERLNVSYIRSAGEADAYAAEVLNPEPDAAASIRVGASVGPVASPVVNQTLDVTDTQGTGMDEELVIEKQIVQQGAATLDLGEGSGTNVEKFNRREKSKGDVTEPGSVYDSDRIADGAVEEQKLVDLSVTEQKLADLAVATNKLQNNAVINGKLDDLSVSETKIQDDSISTPKLVAEAVTANEIEADTITAAQIAVGTITALEIATDTITAQQIAADTISALEIAADTLTANEIDTLDLDTGQITITGTDVNTSLIFEEDSFSNDYFMYPSGGADLRIGKLSDPVDEIVVFGARPPADNNGQIGYPDRAYTGINAYNFIDADTGDPINDGGDPMAGVAEGHGPPDTCEVCDDETGETHGYSVNQMAREAWDVIREQARRIEDLEARLEDLEDGANA